LSLASHLDCRASGILTKQQIADYARSNPGFVAKLQHAYLTGTEPQLTPEEHRILQVISEAALADMKAGCDTCGATPVESSDDHHVRDTNQWLAAGLGAALILLILLYILAQNAPATCYRRLTPIPGGRYVYEAYPFAYQPFSCNLRLLFGLPVNFITPEHGMAGP
jgi:hypothetical protein